MLETQKANSIGMKHDSGNLMIMARIDLDNVWILVHEMSASYLKNSHYHASKISELIKVLQ